MASPELELQAAILPLLKADATLTPLVNGVYDQPPATCWVTPKEGFVTIGEAQTLRDDATCLEGGRVFLTLHGWSRKVGYPAVRAIADAVVEALHLAPLTLPTHRLVSIMQTDADVSRSGRPYQTCGHRLHRELRPGSLTVRCPRTAPHHQKPPRPAMCRFLHMKEPSHATAIGP
ncbi:DUF3168 domain-containing protein [Rhizobium sp. LjRoot98]|uniref:DUF3168 domain-containing protein n=1 Tax=Rhizobium sp. LjRoot98 TaxID=3342345 RepID=UPI003ECC7611